MTAEPLIRAAALALGIAAARRGTAKATAGAGLLLAVATFGMTPRPSPEPGVAAAILLATTALAAFAFHGVWPPIVAEGASWGAALALPAALLSAVTLSGATPVRALAAFFAALAAFSLFAAEATRANSEAGWRRAVAWASAVLAPAGVAFLAALGGRGHPPSRDGALAASGLAVAVVAWVPAAFLEWGRAKRELFEEVRLGILPPEDADVLTLPWRRRFEKRFGRADERREYVRSALLLAVARQQQKRRTGEAARLRQLEILAFRTRLRRTLDARTQRVSRISSDEFSRPVDAD